LNGETRLTIDGSIFSTDQYSAGNIVKLVSSTAVYDCPVHKDGSTEVQIMCYTPQYVTISINDKSSFDVSFPPFIFFLVIIYVYIYWYNA